MRVMGDAIRRNKAEIKSKETAIPLKLGELEIRKRRVR